MSSGAQAALLHVVASLPVCPPLAPCPLLPFLFGIEPVLLKAVILVTITDPVGKLGWEDFYCWIHQNKLWQKKNSKKYLQKVMELGNQPTWLSAAVISPFCRESLPVLRDWGWRPCRPPQRTPCPIALDINASTM